MSEEHSDHDYLGLKTTDAAILAQSRGVHLRHVRVDGDPTVSTRDFRTERLNVAVEKGVISEIFSRG